ncbi:ATP-binding cassette sub- G member 2 [Podochytrium sp. JEL0797]|nr:ATP-binding cassette sub- G member 2 [Podochytrium sp. JEL0797]
MAFMSSKDALQAMGSNFQLNNVVPEEEEDEEQSLKNASNNTSGFSLRNGGIKSLGSIKHNSISSRNVRVGPEILKASPLAGNATVQMNDSDSESFDDNASFHSGFGDVSRKASLRSSLNVTTPRLIILKSEEDFGITVTEDLCKTRSGLSISEEDLMQNVVGNVPEADRMHIAYENLSLKIVQKSTRIFRKNTTIDVETPILKNVSGFFRPGKLTAILGASGAGKTSLLHCIAGIDHNGIQAGRISVNGVSMFPVDMKHISGFVYQEDVICATMTVKEGIHMLLGTGIGVLTREFSNHNVRKVTVAPSFQQRTRERCQ